MKKMFFLIVYLSLASQVSYCQKTKKALFLGNSYTGTNNLPQMVADIALSMGDTLIFDSNAPGGYTLQGHSNNPTSLNKIKAGSWDFVALQEQSQYPSYPEDLVASGIYPYARFLDSMINTYNHCCETIFYMTWGRKNGDGDNCSWWPPVCTYAGMDSLLYLRYMTMTYANDAAVAPVGAVWKYIRQHFPSIDLYMWDGSHPSLAGTYAGACSFYTAMFKKDPQNISFDAGLPAADAANIRTAVKSIVYDSLLKWQIGKYDPVSAFNFHISGNKEIQFNNASTNAIDFLWDFGDNTTSSDHSPLHIYTQEGIYDVKLTAYSCNDANTSTQQIVMGDPFESISFYPNPTSSYLFIGIPDSLIQHISMFNMLGQEFQPAHIAEANKTKIDLSAFPAGIYFVSVLANGNRFTKKIVRR